MSETQVIRTEQDRAEVVAKIARLPLGRPVVVSVAWADQRTPDQNDKFQPMLRDIAAQVEWHGQKLSADDWRAIFVAAVKGQRMVSGLDGSLVVVGNSSKKLSKEQASEMIEMIYSFGNERGVRWSE